MSVPVPAGRGRWRLTLHNRQFTTTPLGPGATGVAELIDARSRRLDQVWNQAAQVSFTIDGRSQSALEIRELQHDVIAWRWDETRGADVPMFYGLISQAEDELTEQSHVVNFTCHDYLAMLARRYWTRPTPINFTQTDQDDIAATLVGYGAVQAAAGDGTDLGPGSYLPIRLTTVGPDGRSRPPSGQIRDRSYLGNQEILAAVDDLANVVGGFDYDYYAGDLLTWGRGAFRNFYPAQGVTRADMALVYGSNVAALTRTVNSSDYANYVRLLGNNGNSDQTAAQLYADIWNGDATSGTAGAVGLWMDADSAADVNQQATLNEQAAGTLALKGILIPSYTVTLKPDTYRLGFPNMGDTVPLVIQSGRLNVNTTVRVLGISYDIGDDGQEDVSLTVGRPAVTLAHILIDNRNDIDALARR